MIETKLLSALLKSRAFYSQVCEVIEPTNYSKHFQLIFNKIKDFYQRDKDVPSVDVDLLLEGLKSDLDNPKHFDAFRLAVERAQQAEVSEGNLSGLLIEAKRQELGTKLSVAIINRDLKKVPELLEGYKNLLEANSLEEMEDGEDDDSDVFEGVDVGGLVEEVNQPRNLIKLFPKILNERVGGGVPRGTHILLYGRPECFLGSTEVLTHAGWVRLDSVTKRTLLAAVNDRREIVFEQPAAVIKRDDITTGYRLYNKKKQIDVVVSPNHRVVYTEKGAWKEDKAKDVKLYQGRKIHTSANGVHHVNKHIEKPYFFGPDDQLKVAYQADGRARVYEASGHFGHEITLTKQRKINRLEEILYASKCSYSSWVSKRPNYGVYFKSLKQCTKDFSDIDLRRVDKEFAQKFCHELKYWDGSERSPSRWKYSNTNKSAVDKAQAIAVIAGYSTFLSTVPDKRGFKPCYELHIRSNYTPVDGKGVVKEEVVISEPMYCVTTSTGKLLVRSNGVVHISGNCGKTAQAYTLTVGFASQGLKVLHISNEDPKQSVKLRLVSCLTGLTKDEILRNPGNAQRLAEDNGLGNVIIASLAPGNYRQIRKLCEKYKPDCIVIDQLRNVETGTGEDNRVIQLEKNGTFGRSLAKIYDAVVVSVTQAGDSASGKAVLDMGDVDFSNTGLPAQADIMIGVGVTEELERNSERCYSLPKNKISGNHEPFYVKINPPISRITST